MGAEREEGATDMNILIRRGYRPGDKVPPALRCCGGVSRGVSRVCALTAAGWHQVLLYDGVCNLCNGWVNFVIDRDPQSRYKFAALQGEAGRAMMTRVGKGALRGPAGASERPRAQK
jgi:hypothetical protein